MRRKTSTRLPPWGRAREGKAGLPFLRLCSSPAQALARWAITSPSPLPKGALLCHLLMLENPELGAAPPSFPLPLEHGVEGRKGRLGSWAREKTRAGWRRGGREAHRQAGPPG